MALNLTFVKDMYCKKKEVSFLSTVYSKRSQCDERALSVTLLSLMGLSIIKVISPNFIISEFGRRGYIN
jgi:hypothetical protein